MTSELTCDVEASVVHAPGVTLHRLAVGQGGHSGARDCVEDVDDTGLAADREQMLLRLARRGRSPDQALDPCV